MERSFLCIHETGGAGWIWEGVCQRIEYGFKRNGRGGAGWKNMVR